MLVTNVDLSLKTGHQTLKVILAGLDVHRYGLLLYIRVRANHHNVSRGGELVDKADEFLIAHNHGLELIVGLNAAELELLDDIGNLLETMVIFVISCIEVRDHQEGTLFEQDYFVSADG